MKRRRTSQPVQTRARQLRQEQTASEALLWEQLRDRRLAGYKFRRQHPLGRFVVDFYCAEKRLIVELDGPVHDRQHERDATREAALRSQGYQLIRFTNAAINSDLAGVCQRISETLKHPSSAVAGAGADRTCV
jgi:very-short-patch-repair endonuclease